METYQTNSFLKLFLYIIGGSATLIILIYAIFMGMYAWSAKKADEGARKVVCEEQKQISYIGKVYKVNRYENYSFMNENYFGVEIETEDTLSKYITYQYWLSDNKELLNYVKSGQSVSKKINEGFYTLKSENGQKRKFFCSYVLTGLFRT